MNMIYADNAATTRMSRTAIDAMLPYFDTMYANPSSLHTAGQEAKEALEQCRADVAKCLGCTSREIYFVSCGTEADNQAIRTAVEIGRRKGKNHIITTAFEHHAVLYTVQQLEKEGCRVTYLDVHENGLVTVDQVRQAICDDTCLVTVMYANNEIGTVQPITEIGRLCRERGVLFHTDAVQAVGHLPVNVTEQCIDMLSLSAHKFKGPKGIGVLYARKGIAPAHLMYGGAQERNKRPGTESIPSIVGMTAALREACDEMEAHTRTILPMRERLIAGLLEIPHSVLNGDHSSRLPGNVNICFEGIEGESMLLMLDAKGICASSGSACTSGSLDPSHVLLAIGRPHEIAHGSLRLTIDENNTPDEIEKIISATAETVAYLRSISPVWRDLTEGKRSYVIQ